MYAIYAYIGVVWGVNVGRVSGYNIPWKWRTMVNWNPQIRKAPALGEFGPHSAVPDSVEFGPRPPRSRDICSWAK